MRYRETQIYRRAMELIDLVVAVGSSVPQGHGPVLDQLRRAASSIPLTYLEGCGRTGKADRLRFFGYAIGSAIEVEGALDVLHRFGAISSDTCSRGQGLCVQLTAMLRKWK